MLENLGQFFDDFAVTAIFGAEQAKVLFDSPEKVLIGDDIITAEYQITYPATVFAALKYRDSITVDGQAFKVNAVQAIDDGKLKIATLSKA